MISIIVFICDNKDCSLTQQSVKKTEKEEKHSRLPEVAKIHDFGLVPRSRYPLVVLLTLADEDNREIYDIVGNLHIFFKRRNLCCPIHYKKLPLNRIKMFELFHFCYRTFSFNKNFFRFKTITAGNSGN